MALVLADVAEAASVAELLSVVTELLSVVVELPVLSVVTELLFVVLELLFVVTELLAVVRGLPVLSVVRSTGVAVSATEQQQPECTLCADVKVSRWSLP